MARALSRLPAMPLESGGKWRTDISSASQVLFAHLSMSETQRGGKESNIYAIVMQ